MRSTPHPSSGLKARAAVWLAAAVCAVSAAQAAPQDRPAADPVLQLLQDRGFVSKESAEEGSTLVRQVRDVASELVLSAMNFLGVPYKRGGNSADDGFDCSGFTRHIFEMSLGLVLPRRVDDQAHASSLTRIGREELRPGDLVGAIANEASIDRTAIGAIDIFDRHSIVEVRNEYAEGVVMVMRRRRRMRVTAKGVIVSHDLPLGRAGAEIK